MDNPADYVQNKKHGLLGHLKTVFSRRKRDKDTHLTAPKPSTSNVTADPDAKSGPANPKNDIFKTHDHNAMGLWQMAYDELTESDRNTLAALLPATTTKAQDVSGERTKEILDGVVKATEAQYREKGGKDGIRATAHKILNSALSFQDVVSNIAKFDPTGYASSAWAIVSLGLTVRPLHQRSQTIS